MPDYTEMQTAMDRLGDKREQGKAHDTRSEAAHQPSQTQAVPPNSTDMECRRDVNVPASDVLANPVPFFDHWFAGCEGVVQLVAISPDGKPLEPYNLEPPYNWNAAAAWAREQSEAGRNVYFCPVTQRPGTTGHRSEATAFELPGVFADVDDVDPETTWPKIEATGFVNATVASSSTGLHVYARFPKPVRVTNENREELKNKLYAYGAGLNVAAHGEARKVDRHDLASLLRFPSTINYPNAKKRAKGREPEPVLLFALPGDTTRPEQLSDWIIAHPRPIGGDSTRRDDGAKPRTVADAKAGELPAEWEDMLASDEILRARFERTKPGPKQTDMTPSGFLLSLFNHLARKYRDRITDPEALAIGVEFYRRAGEAKDIRAIQRTWEEAKTMKNTEYDTTDVGNARRFAKQHGQRIRYVDDWKRWVIYDGKRWAFDTTREVERLAKQTAEAMLQEAYEFDGDDKERMERIRRAVAAKSRYKIAAMIELAKSERAARPEEFNQHPFLLNCQNGTLDLRTGKLGKHNPDDMLTKIVPVSYDPDAKCPRLLAFLERIFDGKARLIGYVQRALGAALVGVMQEQCFHILYGTGANGKSTLIEIVRAVVGDYSMHAAATTFLSQRNPATIRSDLARLKDARFVTASETNKGGALDEATIKALTGGDTITARRLYQGEEEFRSAAHIFLLTNHKPRIKGNDHAIWRRVRLIPFTVTIPPDEQDLNLGAKLREELPGIFAWIVKGAVAVQEAEGRLEPVPEVVEAVEKYRHEMDDVGQFLATCTVRYAGRKVGSQRLYEAYTAWCKDTGRNALGLKAFRHIVEREHGRTSKPTKDGTVWRDMALTAELELTVRCASCGKMAKLEAGRTVGRCSCGRCIRVIPFAAIPLDDAA